MPFGDAQRKRECVSEGVRMRVAGCSRLKPPIREHRSTPYLPRRMGQVKISTEIPGRKAVLSFSFPPWGENTCDPAVWVALLHQPRGRTFRAFERPRFRRYTSPSPPSAPLPVPQVPALPCPDFLFLVTARDQTRELPCLGGEGPLLTHPAGIQSLPAISRRYSSPPLAPGTGK